MGEHPPRNPAEFGLTPEGGGRVEVRAWEEADGKRVRQEVNTQGQLLRHQAERGVQGEEGWYRYEKAFNYDGAGQMSRESGRDFHRDHAYEVDFEYDEEGREIAKVFRITAGPDVGRIRRVEFIYDDARNRIAERGEILETGANPDHERPMGHTWEKEY